MFIECVVRVHRPFNEARQVIGQGGGRWLEPLVDQAYRKGEAANLALRAGKSRRVAKRVLLSVGEPRDRSDGTFLPVRIVATGPVGLFPRLDANLELVPRGPDVTDMRLQGSYEPPFGKVGELLDRTVLHKLAETSIQNLVERIARHIEEATL